MSRSDCRTCSDCQFYLDWFCECPDSPFAFVAPAFPAWSCRYFRACPFPSDAQTSDAQTSEDTEILIF